MNSPKFAMANECASIDEADSVLRVDPRAHKPPPKICSGWERRSARLWEIDELDPDRQQLNRSGRFPRKGRDCADRAQMWSGTRSRRAAEGAVLEMSVGIGVMAMRRHGHRHRHGRHGGAQFK
jgi:hypothetical protein